MFERAPEQWEARDFVVDEGLAPGVATLDGAPVCFTVGESAEANARFIAAGPDMECMLKRAMPYVPGGLRHEIESVLAKAQALPALPPMGYDTAGPGALNDIAP